MEPNLINAKQASKQAVAFDNAKNYEAAIYYYKEAAKYLYLAVINDDSSSEEKEEWKSKMKEYENRAEKLLTAAGEKGPSQPQSADQSVLQKSNFIFGQALDADERDHHEIAVRLYMDTAEYVLSSKDSVGDPVIKNTLVTRAKQALSRAEELKNVKTQSAESSKVTTTTPAVSQTASDSLKEINVGKLSLGSSGGYTAEEKSVLLSTSTINRIKYVPFMDIDLKERFQYAMPFTDKDGFLALAPKQKAEFAEWVRPEMLNPEPCMLFGGLPSFQTIKQTIISDCSFVASLAVSAQYELTFGKQIITCNIFPRNRKNQPMHNPFGKYMIKLHLNGVYRKVIIDDYLPIDKYGRLLCSYSTRSGELWVSLLEKAYMKVMGGYDFPGSNSSIDLHTLTGWIPERLAIRPNEPDFNADAVFQMLCSRKNRGHCLVTVATGPLSEVEEERTGLVSTHAYAVLDIRNVQGVNLLKLKNPWSHIRWRGNYSELDLRHWTPELRSAVGFDPESAASFDDGIFWIDYQSILRFFDVFNLNWNPEIFPHTYTTHQQWAAGQGPARDNYNMGENPQFRLKVPGTEPGSIWIHLGRHITDVQDFKHNTEFIALLVYKTDGNRIYYPSDPPPYIDGVRINSPFYLCKIILTEGGSRTFTLVVSQYEKTTNIYFTLKAYATLPFKLEPIVNNYKHIKKITGEWKGITAGGCKNHPATYNNNPRYLLQTSSGLQDLLIDLKGPKQFAVGFSFEKFEDDTFKKTSTEPYRSGFVVMELSSLPGGKYVIRPTTYLPHQEGPFLLTIKSACPITLQLIQ